MRYHCDCVITEEILGVRCMCVRVFVYVYVFVFVFVFVCACVGACVRVCCRE